MRKSFLKSSLLLILVCGVSFTVGYFFDEFARIKITNEGIWDFAVRQYGGEYTYISPLLECEINNTTDRHKYIPFEIPTLQRIKKEVQEKNPDVTLALYVRSLNNGPWFGINEWIEFSPASLMKLPVFMTYLKWIEKNPAIVEQDIIPSKLELPYDPAYPPSSTVEIGKVYKPKELLESMIIKSDNVALQALLLALPETINNTVMSELWLHFPENWDVNDFMTIQQYASLFRILYNAAYLSRDSSEYALSVLAQSEFNDGIRQGIPKEIVIAHKFGERGYIDEKTKEEVKQLHDCGIVYYKAYPYLMCTMTRGNDFKKLSSIIGQTAKIVHEEISKAFPQ